VENAVLTKIRLAFGYKKGLITITAYERKLAYKYACVCVFAHVSHWNEGIP
jgi:hypothetical protein